MDGWLALRGFVIAIAIGVHTSIVVILEAEKLIQEDVAANVHACTTTTTKSYSSLPATRNTIHQLIANVDVGTDSYLALLSWPAGVPRLGAESSSSRRVVALGDHSCSPAPAGFHPPSRQTKIKRWPAAVPRHGTAAPPLDDRERARRPKIATAHCGVI
ncbi:hypothetical protein BDZ97DRAFT_1917847 [Flammula alnicola]|nr:hypothetical protein BDZ97DRAFT_1917847 [Flammula alnicola]